MKDVWMYYALKAAIQVVYWNIQFCGMEPFMASYVTGKSMDLADIESFQ